MGVLGTGSFTFVAIISHSFNGVRVGDEIRCGHKRTTLCYVFSASVYVAFDYRPSFAFLHTSYTKVARDFLPCFVFKEVTKGGGGECYFTRLLVCSLFSQSLPLPSLSGCFALPRGGCAIPVFFFCLLIYSCFILHSSFLTPNLLYLSPSLFYCSLNK